MIPIPATFSLLIYVILSPARSPFCSDGPFLMTLIIIKFLHYIAIVFSGGVLVGGGVIQSIYSKANEVPNLLSDL